MAKIQTEATAKKWKFLQAVGMLGLVVAAFCGSLATSKGETFASKEIAILAGAIGLPTYALGRIGAWWFHR